MNDLIVSVYHTPRGETRNRRPYVGNPIPYRGDAAPVPGVARSINDPRVGDQNVVLSSRRPARLHRCTGRGQCDR